MKNAKTASAFGIILGAAVLVYLVIVYSPPATKRAPLPTSNTGDPQGSPAIPLDTRTNIRESSRAMPPVPENPLPVPSMIQLAKQLNDPEASVEEDLDVVRGLIDYYRKQNRIVPPGGLNEEIVAGLRGDNPRKLRLIEDSHLKLSPGGELLDRFGTPYYLHPLSEEMIEIRSAGPDQTLWTEDDIALEDETGGQMQDRL